MSRRSNTTDKSRQKQSTMDIKPFTPLNSKQKEFYYLLQNHPVVICNGCAGTGKTLVALWYGLHQISRGNYRQIIYLRSDVGVEYQRGRGALPGDLDEKMAPLLGPLHDSLGTITGNQTFIDYLFRKRVINPVLLEDVRGRSFNDVFILVDETQNFLPNQCKTVLTRMGKGSTICLVGDSHQVDLSVPGHANGLYDAILRLQSLEEVATIEFGIEDIVRHDVVGKILKRYNQR